MKSIYSRSLIAAALLISCNSHNSDQPSSNPLICCNDVPEYCLRQHDKEHILECDRIMSKYKKNGIIDRQCDCVEEIDVIQKQLDSLKVEKQVSTVSVVKTEQKVEKKVVEKAVQQKQTVQKKAAVPVPTPKPESKPKVQPPTPRVDQSKPPIPTFSNVLQAPAVVIQPVSNTKKDGSCVCADCICD